MAKQKIILCDDSRTNLLVAMKILLTVYDVFPVTSAALMFECLKENKPDLILLDIDMPEMDGFEATEILKADANTANIPIIYLTGTIDDEIKQKGTALGAVDFILKPFAPTDLLDRVASGIGG
jgi:putative two-component system response regulator